MLQTLCLRLWPVSDPELWHWLVLAPSLRLWPVSDPELRHWHASDPLPEIMAWFRQTLSFGTGMLQTLTWGYGLFQTLSFDTGMLQAHNLRLRSASDPELLHWHVSDPLPEVVACFRPWALVLACFRPLTWGYGLFQNLSFSTGMLQTPYLRLWPATNPKLWRWHASDPLPEVIRLWALTLACFRLITWDYGLLQTLSFCTGMFQAPYMRLWPVSDSELWHWHASDPLPEVMACFRLWALTLACFRPITWDYGLLQTLSFCTVMFQTPYLRLWPVSDPELWHWLHPWRQVLPQPDKKR